MKWINNIFKKASPVDRPSHQEVQEKIARIDSGSDRATIIVDQQQQEYQNKLKKLRIQAKIVKKEVKNLDIMIGLVLANTGSLHE